MIERKALSSALVAVLLALFASGGPGAAPALGAAALDSEFARDFNRLDPPVPAPLEVFEDLAGARVRLADFRGQVVLVNFWATWCAPCVREMPTLDRLQAMLAGEGLVVAAVSVDRAGRQAVEPFAAKLGLEHLALFLDPKSALARAFGLSGLPTTYLIDRAGRVVRVLAGPAEWDSPEVVALIRHYLEKKSAAQRQNAAAQPDGG